ncbi:hypothetical protein B0T22DRAFT_487661 [Podospora appendiculata]|uniref:Uncharacterized protein n=1 Tax=Podospora appendiculata TaxID=314037 RepID=A0AAE1CH90_9PEZI|nr:hypothetical protein B0T22DRAFT_487661 [Podospora appendiculata]
MSRRSYGLGRCINLAISMGGPGGGGPLLPSLSSSVLVCLLPMCGVHLSFADGPSPAHGGGAGCWYEAPPTT